MSKLSPSSTLLIYPFIYQLEKQPVVIILNAKSLVHKYLKQIQ